MVNSCCSFEVQTWLCAIACCCCGQCPSAVLEALLEGMLRMLLTTLVTLLVSLMMVGGAHDSKFPNSSQFTVVQFFRCTIALFAIWKHTECV